jgi:molybdopterin-guanine dinucleotide biosynthesis protein A
MKFGGIILCGGQSRRMGRSKASLPFGSETMLSRVVRILAEVVQPIVVVAAPEQQLPPLPEQTDIVRDRRSGRGPLEGMAVGLTKLAGDVDAAYVTSCDVPLLKPNFVRRMCELLAPHEICVPRDGKFHHPLSAVYQTCVLPTIERLIAEDRMRPIFLFDERDTRRVDVEQLRAVDPGLDSLENLNTPDDYRRALRRAGRDEGRSKK